MIEAIAYGVICFFICNTCFLSERLKKGACGTLLFFALSQAYNTLQPLLPPQVDAVLHSTIWGVLCAYAVPSSPACKVSQKTDEKDENYKEKDGVEKQPEKDETPPISDLN
jgi:hypothetical protein